MIKKHIPNTITCLNAFSGCLAIVAAMGGDYRLSALFVALAALFDFLDGFAARLLHVVSPTGKELDSLADTISFSLAPSFVLFHFLSHSVAFCSEGSLWNVVLPYSAFLLAVFSILRLAKFNLDERQTSSFIGLATPADAIFWIFLLGWYGDTLSSVNGCWFLPLIAFFSFLMVSELPMFSLKFKSLRFSEHWVQWVFLAGCLVLLLTLGWGGLAFAILWYIWLSVGVRLFKHSAS